MSRQTTNLLARCRSTLKTLAERYESRRLAADAASIIDSETATRAPPYLRKVSEALAADLALARDAESAGEPGARVLERLRARHREARQRHQQAALSGATLAIIHVRSRQIGAAADPARARVDAFLQEWQPL